MATRSRVQRSVGVARPARPLRQDPLQRALLRRGQPRRPPRGRPGLQAARPGALIRRTRGAHRTATPTSFPLFLQPSFPKSPVSLLRKLAAQHWLRRCQHGGADVTHVDLPAQMLLLSVWLSPVCRSGPAGFPTADIFLHLRDAPRSASGERPWPGSRCWRTGSLSTVVALPAMTRA